MPSVSIILDGVPTEIEAGTTATALLEKERDIVAVRVDGELRDPTLS